LTMALVIPATLGMMALAHPIIRLIYERNAFSPADTSIVASLLISYGPYIVFISILKIFSNALYAVRDSKTPLIVILYQQLINIILNILLVKVIGIDGIALATSISTLIGSVCLLVAYHKKFGKAETNEHIISIIKISISSIFMVLITRFINRYFSDIAGPI